MRSGHHYRHFTLTLLRSIKKLLSPGSPSATAKLRLQRQSMVALNQLDRFDIQDHNEIQ